MQRQYFVTDKYSLATKENERLAEEKRLEDARVEKEIAKVKLFTKEYVMHLVALGHAVITGWAENSDGTKEPCSFLLNRWEDI